MNPDAHAPDRRFRDDRVLGDLAGQRGVHRDGKELRFRELRGVAFQER